MHKLFAHLQSGEQRPVTVLMTDVTGFTSLGAHAEPEWLFNLINEVFGELVEVLVAHGAHIDKYVGDEIMALFGVPLAQERTVERALRAALAAHDRLRVLNSRGRFGSTNPSVHTGVNLGTVMIGAVGHSEHADYTVIGDAVNVTKRLEDQAPDGAIYVGEAVQQIAAKEFEFEPLGEFVFAGREEPVVAYRLLGVKDSAPADTSVEYTPLVAREAELELIGQYAHEAASSDQTIVYILGPDGIGKSGLIEEWQHSADAQPFRTIKTSCHIFGEHFPLLPLVEIVTQLVGLRITGWPPHVAGDVAEAMKASMGDEMARERLAALLRSLDQPLDEESGGSYESLCAALTALLADSSDRSPLCLIIEDVQWIDETSHSILLEVLGERRQWPLLVLLSARELEDKWPEGQLGEHRLRLGPMPRKSMERLVQRWAAPAVLSEPRLQAICERAEGRLHFARELIRAFKQRSEGELRDDLALPASVEESLLSELDALPPALRRLVQAASVVGEPMSYSILEGAIGPDVELTGALLASATHRGLFRTGSAPGQFVFARPLLFEAVYGTIPPTQRKSLHARLAAYMEGLVDEMGDAAIHTAAHHAYFGYYDERAVELLLRSARVYRLQYANRQAIGSVSRAIEIIASLHEPGKLLDQRLEALLLMAQSYEVVGELPSAEGALAEAEVLVEQCDDADLVARIATAAATLYFMEGDLTAAEEGFKRARDACRQLGNEPREGHALLGMGMCAQQTGRHEEALELFAQAAERGASALWVKAAALNNAGVVLIGEGRYAEAERYVLEGLQANEEDGDRRGVAHSKASMGELCFRLARLDEAREWLHEAAAEAEEIEDAECVQLATIFLTRVHAIAGDTHAAQEALDALSAGEATGDAEMLALWKIAELDAEIVSAKSREAQSGDIADEASPGRLSDLYDEHAPTCSNAYVEMLCLEAEAALLRGHTQAADGWAELVADRAPKAADRHLRRYAQWLLEVVRRGGEGVAPLSQGDEDQPTVFENRSRRLLTQMDSGESPGRC